MRINVYSQELTKEIRIIETVAKDTGITYRGVRMYLASPDVLHHTSEDDDRSAVTFWIPHAKSFTAYDLASIFRDMSLFCYEIAQIELQDKLTEKNP